MKLKTLKPKLQTLRSGPKTLTQRPDATPRMRGRALQEKRESWFRLHPLCVPCQEAGRTTVARILDHRIPLWMGGADDDSNRQGICPPCHDIKTAAEAGERARRDRSL